MLTENDVEQQQQPPVVAQAVPSLDAIHVYNKYLMKRAAAISTYTGWTAFFLFWVMISVFEINNNLRVMRKDTSTQVELLRALIALKTNGTDM